VPEALPSALARAVRPAELSPRRTGGALCAASRRRAPAPRR
jgi:hypothetical protein